jgi:hypothetical protein
VGDPSATAWPRVGRPARRSWSQIPQSPVLTVGPITFHSSLKNPRLLFGSCSNSLSHTFRQTALISYTQSY